MRIADQVRQHLETHPNASSREIAKAIGKTTRSVNKAAKAAGIVIRFMTQAEKTAALKDFRHEQLRNAMKTAAQRNLPPVPKLDFAKPKVKRSRPKDPRFFLKDRAGLYVHQSLTPDGEGLLMVGSTTYAWRPTREQMVKAAETFPTIAEMRVEDVDE